MSSSLFAQSKHNICVASLNSKNEEDVFKKYVKNKQRQGKEMGVQFTNLIEDYDPDLGGGKDPNKSSSDWFKEACNKKNSDGSPLQCDVLLISGHFAESFFGPRTGLTLGLNEMEKHSCQQTCDGLLKHPKEVFLMGCNTLADKSKSKNGRDFDSYVKDLTTDVLNNSTGEKIPVDIAERIAMARYGPFGASLKDRMRSVFGSNSQLYGFDDRGPSGATVEQYLKSYLDELGTMGGIEKYLDKEDAIDLNSSLEQVQRALQRMNNPILTAHLDPGGNGFSDFTQCGALNQFDPEYEMKKNICKLHNKDSSISQRLQAGIDLIQSDDYHKYLPSVTEFIKENYHSLSANLKTVRLLKKLAKNTNLKTRLEDILKELRFKSEDALPANQLDIFLTQKLLGYISDDELEVNTKKILRKQFKNIDGSNHNLLCTLNKTAGIKIAVNYKMFEPDQLKTAHGVRAMDCFQTKDNKITAEAMQAIREPASDKELTYMLLGLSDLPKTPSQEEEINNFAKSYIDDSNPNLSEPAHRVILRTGNSTEVQRSMETLLKGRRNANYVSSFISENPKTKSERVSATALELLKREQDRSPKPSSYALQLAKIFANITPDDSRQWTEFSQLSRNNISKVSPAEIELKQFVFKEVAKSQTNNSSINDLAIALTEYDIKIAKENAKVYQYNGQMKSQGSSSRKGKNHYYDHGHTTYLQNAELSLSQYQRLKQSLDTITKVPTKNNKEHWRARLYRSILNNQEVRSTIIPGKVRNFTCTTVNTYQTLCK